jgi:hypothetical protein
MSEVDEKAHYLAGIRRSRIMAVIFVSLAILVGYVGSQNQYRSMTVDKPASARIEYHVTGTSSNIRVIYLNDLAYRAEKVGTPPWKFSFRATKDRILEVQVDNLSADGTIGCEILVYGEPINTIEETTDSTITCTAVVP